MARAFEERVAQKEHPRLRIYPVSADWRMGCAGSVCYDLAFALETFFCFPCAAGYLMNNIESGKLGLDWTPCCAICAGCYVFPLAGPFVTIAISHQLRQKTIDRFNIKVGKESCCDKMTGCFCCYCNLCQIRTELMMREEANATMCADPSPNYTIEKWGESRMGGVNPNNAGTMTHSPAPNVNPPSHPVLHAHYDGYVHNNPHHFTNQQPPQAMVMMMPPSPFPQPQYYTTTNNNNPLHPQQQQQQQPVVYYNNHNTSAAPAPPPGWGTVPTGVPMN